MRKDVFSDKFIYKTNLNKIELIIIKELIKNFRKFYLLCKLQKMMEFKKMNTTMKKKKIMDFNKKNNSQQYYKTFIRNRNKPLQFNLAFRINLKRLIASTTQ